MCDDDDWLLLAGKRSARVGPDGVPVVRVDTSGLATFRPDGTMVFDVLPGKDEKKDPLVSMEMFERGVRAIEGAPGAGASDQLRAALLAMGFEEVFR